MVRIVLAFAVTIVFDILFLGAIALASGQEPLTSDNSPAIVVQADSFGADSVLDSLHSLRFNLDKAQAELDSLTPVSSFTSAAHRAAFYQAAASLKRANVQLFSYMASVDPNNRLSWIAKARLSKRQADVAMGEYYKSLPSEGVPVIEHQRLKISSN